MKPSWRRGVGRVAGPVLAGGLAFTATAPAVRGAAETFEREAYVMGTRVRIVVEAASRSEALPRLERALATIEGAEAELSTWRDDTPLSAINRQPDGGAFELPASLCETLREVDVEVRRTGHAFDPAVGALVDAWGLRRGGRVPSPGELDVARLRSGWGLLSFDAVRCVITRRRDVVLEEGAFGKGAALDRVRSLFDHSADRGSWLVDLGGQLAVGGTRTWDVALADPGDRHRPAATLHLREGSVATSGGAERDTWVGGQRIGHILDPRTGRPTTYTGTVVTWHDRALVADALSTALHVMGSSEGLAWAERHEVAACFLESRTDTTLSALASAAFRSRFPGTCGDSSGPGLTAR